MNILLLSPVFPPAVGGIEQHVMNLAKQLKLEGHSVSVLTTTIGIHNNSTDVFDFPVFALDVGLQNNNDLALNGRAMIPEMALQCFKLCLKEKFDVLHAHCPFSLSAALPSKFLLGKKVILTVHGNWINCVKGSRYFNGMICNSFEAKKCSRCMQQPALMISLKQAFLKFIATQANCIIAVSNDVKKSFDFSYRNPVHVIPNVSSSIKLNNSKNSRDLLFVGSMQKEKGAILLVRAIALLKKRFPKISASFVFAHFQKNYLESVLREVELNNLDENIDFFENIPNFHLRQNIFPQHNIVVVPSVWPEPCSSVITEAMNAGKTVIASNIGGNTDLIENNVNGLLFNSGNAENLSKTIESVLLNNSLNNSFKKNSLELVQKELNWERIARKTLNVYRSTLM